MNAGAACALNAGADALGTGVVHARPPLLALTTGYRLQVPTLTLSEITFVALAIVYCSSAKGARIRELVHHPSRPLRYCPYATPAA